MKISNKTAIASLIALLYFTGCAPLFNNSKEYYVSKVELNSTPVHQNIINDITHFLTQYYPIAQTTFAITIENSSYKHGIELENSLRKAGYGITYHQKEGAIPFAYKLDLMNKTIIRATYNIGSANISRLYQQNASSLQAITPFTTRGLGKKVFINTATPQQHALKSATVTALTLNVRHQPSTNAKVIDKYHKGDTIQVHSSFMRKGVSWAKVHSESGIECYVATQYIMYLD